MRACVSERGREREETDRQTEEWGEGEGGGGEFVASASEDHSGSCCHHHCRELLSHTSTPLQAKSHTHKHSQLTMRPVVCVHESVGGQFV